mgnify:CR=1 FL=1
MPHSTHQEILEWSREAKWMKCSFEPSRTQRKKTSRMFDKMTSTAESSSNAKQDKAPGKPELDMFATSYDFKPELLSLLSSSVFNDINNLDLNPNDVFSKYQSPSGRLNCFNAGKWCSTSCNKMCVKSLRTFSSLSCFPSMSQCFQIKKSQCHR